MNIRLLGAKAPEYDILLLWLKMLTEQFREQATIVRRSCYRWQTVR